MSYARAGWINILFKILISVIMYAKLTLNLSNYSTVYRIFMAVGAFGACRNLQTNATGAYT